MSAKFRWGILGTGSIANQFADGLEPIEGAELAAVGSRNEDTARAFAEKHGARRHHASYEALAQDGELDAIYVSSPHSFHCENTLLLLEHGQSVLCEKPFAINLSEVHRMIAKAKEKERFLMEAMWTRFNPAIVEMGKLLDAGAIGEPRQVTADFGFRADFDPRQRLFNPELGGGALLDVGIYPITFARLVFRQDPESIVSEATIGETGIDEQSAYLFRYEDGGLALLSSAVRTETPHEGVVCGSEGTIRVPRHFWRPDRLEVNGEERRIPFLGNGYTHEAMHVMDCVRAGKRESDIMSWSETIAVQKTLDTIRAQWGLRYPGE
ncbi:MAG: Gfo/Idh/MocA family oxidoreductase [Planctomycetota bacterium]